MLPSGRTIRRVLIGSALVLAGAAVGIGVGLGVGLEARQAGPHGFGDGFDGILQGPGPERGGPMMGRRGFGPRGLGALGLRRLDLDDGQREQVRTIIEQHREPMTALAERVHTAHRELQDAIEADVLNEAAIREKSAALAQVQADTAVLRASIRAQVVQLLTPEQKQRMQELKERARQRFEERRERRQERRPPPPPGA